MTKEIVLETIKDYEGEFSINEFMERLIFVEKIEKGLKQAEKGEVISHDDVKNIVSKWSK